MDNKSFIEREFCEGYNDTVAVRKLETDTIRNYIWLRVSCGQPVPANLSLNCLRNELIRRGERPFGYHDT